MPAQWVAFYSIFSAPLIGHVRANLPQLREKFVAHAFLEDFDRTALERFGTEADGAVNQLHVLIPEFLKQFVELGQRFRNDVRVTVRVFRVIDLFQRQPMLDRKSTRLNSSHLVISY